VRPHGPTAPLSPEFTAPRLVAVYDALNPYACGTQPDFYLRTARECGARSVVEVGCGTGLITRLFLAEGYDVTGIDPSAAMLEVARARPGAAHARWIHGDVGALVAGAPVLGRVDFAFMAGHVAQFLVSDASWRNALHVLRAALRDGGHLAFESRNPGAREWEAWSASARDPAVDTPEGPVERWIEVGDVRGDVVVYRLHYRFLDDGEELVADAELRFRSVEALRHSLDEAGFVVTQAYGDWDRSPLDARSPEIILVAAAR
jgi:SAM-dependent methyltransferase